MKPISVILTFCLLAPWLQSLRAEETNSNSGTPAVLLSSNAVVISADFLNELFEHMRTNHPALRAAFSRTKAAEANIGTIRTWDDPMLSVGGMAAERMMRRNDGDLIYGVDQKIPLFGKPGAERRVAAAEASVEAARLEYQFQQRRAAFAQAAFRAALANETVSIGEEDLAWLDLMRRTIDSKYESGQATLVEVIQLSNEQERRATALQTERDQLRHEMVTLNRFLNRDQQAAWPRLLLPEPGPAIAFNQRLVEFAIKYEPKVRLIREEIRTAEASVDVAKRNRYPDVSVGLEARNYTGNGSFRQGMFVVSSSLPWVNTRKYRNEVKRERERLSAAEHDLADYQAELREEVHLLTVKIDAARRESLLYRDQIIPRTRAALETIRANWEANRASVRDLLEARRMLLEARLMYARAVAEQYEMMSDLVLCCGLGDLSALEMLANADASAAPSISESPK
jgi:Outer membrane protein